MCRIYNLRKPKTNIQILQQNVLLKHRHLMQFLRRHGRDVAAEVRAAYIETLSRVLSGHFKAYLTALEPLQVCLQQCFSGSLVQRPIMTEGWAMRPDYKESRKLLTWPGLSLSRMLQRCQPALAGWALTASCVLSAEAIAIESFAETFPHTAWQPHGDPPSSPCRLWGSDVEPRRLKYKADRTPSLLLWHHGVCRMPWCPACPLTALQEAGYANQQCSVHS